MMFCILLTGPTTKVPSLQNFNTLSVRVDMFVHYISVMLQLYIHRSERHILLVLWSILMSIFTLMAFTIPKQLRDQSFPENITGFLDASGAIRPEFEEYFQHAYRPVLYIFGSGHLLLSIWMSLEYFIVNWPNFKLPNFYYSLMTRYINNINMLVNL